MGIPLTFHTVPFDLSEGFARNWIADNAKVKYLAFINSDNVMHPKRLEIFKYIYKNSATQPVIVLHGFDRRRIIDVQVPDDVDYAFIKGEIFVPKQISRHWNDGRKITPWCRYNVQNAHPTIRTDVFLKVKQSEFPRGTDQEFIRNVFKKTRQYGSSGLC